MLEINLCSVCARMNCTAANHATAPLRSCQECTSYAPESEMVGLNDGRLVCKSCAGKVRKLGAERAQLSMFGQDSLTF